MTIRHCLRFYSMSPLKSSTSSSPSIGDCHTPVPSMDSQGTDHKRQSLNQHVQHVRRMAIEVAQGTSTWSRHTAAAVDAVTFFTLHPAFDTSLARPVRIEVITTLQQVAYHKSNGEPISLVADWCASEWLRLCEEQNDDVDALYGLALSWLHRSQAVLYKIYELDRRSSSSSSASGSGRSFERDRLSFDSHSIGGNSEDNEAKVNSADYVQARTSLQPATEYFDKAINAAMSQQRRHSEELLARAAEANISLGNTSSSRINERYYRRAIELLRQSIAAGYSLTPSLQSFLDEYGRFVE